MIEIMPLKKLDSEISVPGSKYIANRVLLIAALAEKTSKIKNVPDNEDINAAIGALKKFGVKIKKENNSVKVYGTNGKLKCPSEEINVHNSGTLMRFIAGFASLADGKTTITGSKRIQERPIKDLLDSLKDLGVKCISLNNGFPPIEINGGALRGGLRGGTTKIKGGISSQFISALLLIAPYARNDVEIIIKSDLVSKSYVDMTISLMKNFNVDVKNERYKKFKVKSGQKYIGKEFEIPADWSSANYFLAAAAIIPGRVRIKNMDMEENGEAFFIDALEKMGCKAKKYENCIELTGKEKLNAIEIDMSLMPDSVQTLAAVAVFAKGATKIKNIGNLKYKESDRINDTALELKKLGAGVIANDDELIIEGNNAKNIKPAIIDSHNDHRMAMSFALIGLKVGIKIKNPECVNKSFPQFWDKLREIGARVEYIERNH